jgi:predicted nucleic acid-binding protein
VNKYVYDSGALIAIDNRPGDPLRRHEARLARGHQVIVPAPVAAQVVREPGRQARVMLILRGCKVVPFTSDDVAPIGRLLDRAGTAEVVDGFVAFAAATARASVVSSNADDIRHLFDALGVRLPVLSP